MTLQITDTVTAQRDTFEPELRLVQAQLGHANSQVGVGLFLPNATVLSEGWLLCRPC